MKAITIIPGKPNSAAVQDVPEPDASEGSVLVRALELGICGTDFELISAEYGWPPKGRDYLILGHESLGVVEQAPNGGSFKAGDLVVGIVRHPDPVPCVACAVGEWDMCRNGEYTERGIKERNGFGSERWRTQPEFAVKLDSNLRDVGVLMEPTTILAKAWDHITRIGERAKWQPKTVLVTGAGPIGLIAALMGKQRGLDVHVLDVVKEGLKPELVKTLGGTYHTDSIEKVGFRPDVIIECTGVAPVIAGAMAILGNDGILCLAGVSSHNQKETLDLGTINRTMVLENSVIFGTVNANRHHYEMAEEALLKSDRTWLSRLISRRVPLSDFHEALHRRPDDIKVVIEFAKN
ncbi:MAG: glucose 1-dehydrogenase [Acidobacteriaceae bacterium]|nr:glucose 1-dehydrogenase [Acidobacteriaceae bacterium]MBV8572191.1 glucose 1-dehydrogenase [Acidobacteriaceae bacterium]